MMIDWAEVVMASVRAEGRGWRALAVLVLHEEARREGFVQTFAERLEDEVFVP